MRRRYLQSASLKQIIVSLELSSLVAAVLRLEARREAEPALLIDHRQFSYYIIVEAVEGNKERTNPWGL